MRRIRKCAVCEKYTMKAEHCGKPSKTAHPMKYSPEDKFARFRRKGLE